MINTRINTSWKKHLITIDLRIESKMIKLMLIITVKFTINHYKIQFRCHKVASLVKVKKANILIMLVINKI
jgi:hypothetical protein